MSSAHSVIELIGWENMGFKLTTEEVYFLKTRDFNLDAYNEQQKRESAESDFD